MLPLLLECAVQGDGQVVERRHCVVGEAQGWTRDKLEDVEGRREIEIHDVIELDNLPQDKDLKEGVNLQTERGS